MPKDKRFRTPQHQERCPHCMELVALDEYGRFIWHTEDMHGARALMLRCPGSGVEA